MTPDHFTTHVIDHGLLILKELGGPDLSDDARRLLLAIAQQESGASLNARYQNSPSSSPGPARGWWQFEQGGGVAGVLQHGATKALAARVCTHLSVVAASAAVWRALEGNDALASCFARLLVFTDPHPLPTNEGAAWECYLRLWRPGKPHPDSWPKNWSVACSTIDE